MRRDIRGKVELSIQQTTPQRSVNKIISISKIEKSENIIKVFKRNERNTKNQKFKLLFKSEHYLCQRKGRRTPLRLLKKVEYKIKKLINNKQIIPLKKCKNDLFVSLVITTGKQTNLLN